MFSERGSHPKLTPDLWPDLGDHDVAEHAARRCGRPRRARTHPGYLRGDGRTLCGFYTHDRTTATTHINDNIVLCVLENVLTEHEDALVASGARRDVIDGRVAFQTSTEDEFTAAVERLTDRRVIAFMSANQTNPGVACELISSTPRRRSRDEERVRPWVRPRLTTMVS